MGKPTNLFATAFMGSTKPRKAKASSRQHITRVMGRRPNERRYAGAGAAANRTAVWWVDRAGGAGPLGGAEETDPYKIARATFESIAGEGDRKWDKFLHDGFLADSASDSVFAEFDISTASAAWKENAKETRAGRPTAVSR